MNAYEKQTLGQWKNAPLVFVLAQVRFAVQSDGFTDSLQQAVAGLVPNRFQPSNPLPLMQVSIEIGEGGTQKQNLTQVGTLFNLVDQDGRMLVRVAPDSLTLAVTTYTRSQDFRDLWLPMVSAIAGCGLTGSVTRLGLRYVDFVVPSEGETVEQYVNAPWSLQGFAQLPGASEVLPGLNFNMMDVGFPKGRMRLQFLRGFGKPNLPADLQGMLEPESFPFERPDAQSAVIDTDRWIEGVWEPQSAELGEDFTTMHMDLSQAFKHMVTDHAKNRWDPQEQTA